MKRLEAFFGNILLTNITVAYLRAYRHERVMSTKANGERLNVSTVNRELSTLRTMLNEALVNDWITVNPFSKTRPGELIRIADERKRQTVLTRSQEEKLLKAFDETRSRRGMKTVIIAALDTGARKGELLKIRWHDIDFEARVIRNVQSYKGKSVACREVPLTARLGSALLRLLDQQNGLSPQRKLKKNFSDKFVFPFTKSRVQYHWDKVCVETDLQDVHFHDLRHTTGTRLAPEMELALVGQVLGHTDPKTTLRYVNVTRAVIDKAARILDAFNSTPELFNI
jgi:integrase